MEEKKHVCPVWIGYLMASPLRKMQQNPTTILSPYIQKGMNILEIGPAMGYFSIPMAKMTGSEGMVHCVDIQENMLRKLERRAIRNNVIYNIETILATGNTQNIEHLKGKIDFCLLAYVVHEVPDKVEFFKAIVTSLKPGGKALFIEPRMHVKEEDWFFSLDIAREAGFELVREVKISGSRGFELIKAS